MDKIEKYIVEHSDPESELLASLNRETHHKILMPRMLSGHIQGKLLEMISRMINPAYIVEIGTYTGYSALCLAQGLTENGQLHSIEINDELESIIRKYFEKSGLSKKIHLHIGDAKDIIVKLGNSIDMAFIDGDKREYIVYYQLLIDKVRSGGFILADNVLWGGKVTEPLGNNDEYTKGIIEFNHFVQHDNRVENFILPVRDGIMLIRKK
jgi:predicted O-methyltransferase YrrM